MLQRNVPHQNTAQGNNRLLRGTLISAVVFLLMLALAVSAVDSVGRTSDEQQLIIVEDAVRRSLVTCYAVEGAYPDNVEYLESCYGLSFNHEEIAVFIDGFGANIMPQILVTKRGDGLK